MKRRCRQHVNPLKMTSLVPREAVLQLPPGPPLEAELGCGDARFLLELARRQPDALFVGLDIRGAFLEEARVARAELGLENVLLEEANFIVDAGRLFPPGRVRRLYINFPDPWFKRRQHNRRWLTDEVLDQLLLALAPGGRIFFQSDVWELALDALALMESKDSLVNLAGPWTFLRENPFAARTSRELACLEEGLAIWRMQFASEPLEPGSP